MAQCVALLRAINVGGRTVKMDRLRAVFEAMGFSNVDTLLASGNVLFESAMGTSKALERMIEQELRAALGFEVAVFARSRDAIARIAGHEPFPGVQAGVGRYIVFVAEPVGPAASDALIAARTANDDFQVHGREIHWLCRTPLSQSPFSGPLLERIIAMPATVRGAKTIKRIAARHAPV